MVRQASGRVAGQPDRWPRRPDCWADWRSRSRPERRAPGWLHCAADIRVLCWPGCCLWWQAPCLVTRL